MGNLNLLSESEPKIAFTDLYWFNFTLLQGKLMRALLQMKQQRLQRVIWNKAISERALKVEFVCFIAESCFYHCIVNTRIKHDNKSLQNTYETYLFIVHTTVKSRDRTSIILEGQTKLNLMWPTEEIYFLFVCNKILLGNSRTESCHQEIFLDILVGPEKMFKELFSSEGTSEKIIQEF